MKTLDIYIKEWHDKISGNTYFSAKVVVDNEKEIILPFQYGYGDQVLVEVANKLSINHNLKIYCKDHGITFYVSRKNCLNSQCKNKLWW